MNFNFYKYALPLIQGEVQVPYENGVPDLVQLNMEKVGRKLGAHSFE
jgi:6-phosphofructokinase 1